MRRHLLFVFIFFAVNRILAQGIPVSTGADSPLWYYIQFAGENGKVLSALDAQVTSADMISDAGNADVDKQLWRFEGNSSDGFLITNKSNGKQMYLLAQPVNKRVVVRLYASKQYKFGCKMVDGGVQLISKTPVTTAGYADQVALADQSGSIGAASEDKATTFNFVVYDDGQLNYSNEDATYWYRINSCLESLPDHAITDSVALGGKPLPVAQTERNSFASQWKLVKNENGGVCFVNRSSGKMIAAASEDNGKNNVTQTAEQNANGGVFTMDYVGNNSYLLKGVEDDGIERNLAVASDDEEIGMAAPENLNKSKKAWKFELVASIITGIDSVTGYELNVDSKNGRIYMNGCSDWHIYNVNGMEMPRTTSLPEGIYVVKTPGRTLKVNLTK